MPTDYGYMGGARSQNHEATKWEEVLSAVAADLSKRQLDPAWRAFQSQVATSLLFSANAQAAQRAETVRKEEERLKQQKEEYQRLEAQRAQDAQNLAKCQELLNAVQTKSPRDSSQPTQDSTQQPTATRASLRDAKRQPPTDVYGLLSSIYTDISESVGHYRRPSTS